MTTYTSGVERSGQEMLGEWAVTAWTEDLSLAGTEAGAANVAACLATLIKQLIQKGILKGSVVSV